MRETWRGSTWAITHSPDANPTSSTSTPNDLDAASCPTPFYCVAVGQTFAGFTSADDSVSQTLVAIGPAIPFPTIRLAPKHLTVTLGHERCETASVTDWRNQPIARALVVFTVTGANHRSGSRPTDSHGSATYCYASNKAGIDQVVAAVERIRSKAATVTWTKN